MVHIPQPFVTGSRLTPGITRRETPAKPRKFSMTSTLIPVGWMPTLDGGACEAASARCKERVPRYHGTGDVTRGVLPRRVRQIQRRERRVGCREVLRPACNL